MASLSCPFYTSSTTRPHGLIRCIYVIFTLSPLFRLGSGAESVSWLPPPADSVPPTLSPIQTNASILVSYSSMPVVESDAQMQRIASIANVSTLSSPSLPPGRGAFAAPPRWYSKRHIVPVTNASQQEPSFVPKLQVLQTRSYPILSFHTFQEESLPGFLSAKVRGDGSNATTSTSFKLDLSYLGHMFLCFVERVLLSHDRRQQQPGWPRNNYTLQT